MKKRRKSHGTEFIVQKVLYEGGKYYFSMWGNSSTIPFNEYFGSGKCQDMPVGKEVIIKTTSKSTAIYTELKCIMDNINDPLMQNDLIKKGLLKSHIKFGEIK